MLVMIDVSENSCFNNTIDPPTIFVFVKLLSLSFSHQLPCSPFATESPADVAPELLISTQRRAYLVNINKEMPATNPAGMNTPPDTHLLPMIPANIAATNIDKWKLDGFCEV